ncbi:MAG TPA: sigma-70 family RNA polymerase sigma factor [Candidatus Dormibacteraeota bacterium]
MLRSVEPEPDADARERLPDDIAAQAPRLRGFAYSLTRDAADAEDLAQETVARALGAADRFRPGTNLSAWLFAIARNLHISRIRTAARRPSVSADELEMELPADPGVFDPVEQAVLARADVRALMAAFRTLPPTFAEPLRLTAIEEMTYQQVADKLGVPIGTVMSRIYRGRRLLMRRLAEGGS